MPRKPQPAIPKPIEDPFLDLLEATVKEVLENPEAKPREKATMVAHGIRLAFIRFRIKGPPEGESFFG